MRLEWDERKNQANIQKHGLDFADAGKIFSMPMLVALDDREDYGEEPLDRDWLVEGVRRRGHLRRAQ